MCMFLPVWDVETLPVCEAPPVTVSVNATVVGTETTEPPVVIT